MQKVSQSTPRPPEDCKPTAPFVGAMCTPGFAFAPAIAAFNAAHTEPSQPARVLDLMVKVFEQTGVPLDELVLTGEEAQASFDAFQEVLKPPKRKATAQAGDAAAQAGDAAAQAGGAAAQAQE